MAENLDRHAGGFVHLNVHTEYSLVDSVIRVKDLVATVKRHGMGAVAVTDFCNLFALVKFYRAALLAGVKPIVGAEISLRGGSRFGAGKLTLLVRDATGYLNLCQLLSKAYLHGQQQGVPTVTGDWLAEHHAGLLVLSGGASGPLGPALIAGEIAAARALAKQFIELAPDGFYLELQRTGRAGDEQQVAGAVELAVALDLPVVATNCVRFLARESFEEHEARVCIQQGWVLDDPRRPRDYSEEQYLRGQADMQAVFQDLPEALLNTVEVARRCNFVLQLGQAHLPAFSVPEGRRTNEYLAEQSKQGLRKLLSEIGVDQPARRELYAERLDTELATITQMGFASYFLIVADFIRWARDNAVPVGPGRGSGAGSLVAYALSITRIDPLVHGLLFERFLNPERLSLPDFDIDFCMEKRDLVIDYVAERYGRQHVSQIITYGTMAAKAVVRDVGRILGYAYGFVDSIAKLVPFEIGITLAKALEQEPELRRRYQAEDEVRALIDLAQSLEGLARNAGKHAGGIVIAPQALTTYAPLFCEPGGAVVTQFDKDDAEAIGLVKFDFLGLKTLTIIDWAVTLVRNGHSGFADLDIDKLPLDDRATYALLSRAETTGVFQLESRGIKELIKRLLPDRFDEVIALVALYRPGPLQSGMVDDFIERKHGNRTVHFLDPRLEQILKSTYGVILYQEQVMQIAQVLAGYSLGQADILRRAMGKKKPQEMATQRAVFLRGCAQRQVAERVAGEIFDLMEKFAGYGFNKSHSAAYALVSYQTAWLKAHFPSEFMAAALSADMDTTDKVLTLVEECARLKLAVAAPNVNDGIYRFSVADDGSIVYGLGAIKGLGAAAAEELVAQRETGGPYRSLVQLCRRLDLKKVNRRALEALIRAGALDVLGVARERLLASLPNAIDAADRRSRDAVTGQNDLFGEVALVEDELPFVDTVPWTERQRLAAEREALGLYLSGHPMDTYRDELRGIVRRSISEVGSQVGGLARVAGLVLSTRTVAKRRSAFVTLDDPTGRLEVEVGESILQAARQLLRKDDVVVVEGRVEEDKYTGGYKVIAEAVMDVAGARQHYARSLCIRLATAVAGPDAVSTLAKIVARQRGGNCQLNFAVENSDATALFRCRDWSIRPSSELVRDLGVVEGVTGVDFEFR